jgi:hypothetical protein
MVAKLREEDLRHTNNLMAQKVEDYIAPLKAVKYISQHVSCPVIFVSPAKQT